MFRDEYMSEYVFGDEYKNRIGLDGALRKFSGSCRTKKQLASIFGDPFYESEKEGKPIEWYRIGTTVYMFEEVRGTVTSDLFKLYDMRDMSDVKVDISLSDGL